MILEERTFEKFGYCSSDLKPNSGRKILAACDGCGKIREIPKCGYRNLCMSCARRGKKRSDETKRKIGDAKKGKKYMLGRKHTLESRKKMSEALKGKTRTEECKQRISNSLKGRHHTEETLQKMRNGCRKGENNPNWHKSMTDEQKQKISISRRGKCCGKENHRWCGGTSFEPYCQKFNNNLRERVRNFFNRRCYMCNKTEQEQMDEMKRNGKRAFRLAVHHVNYNKMMCCNDVKPLFVPLCNNCHSKINSNKEFYEEFFTESLLFLTNGKCYYTIDEINNHKNTE